MKLDISSYQQGLFTFEAITAEIIPLEDDLPNGVTKSRSYPLTDTGHFVNDKRCFRLPDDLNVPIFLYVTVDAYLMDGLEANLKLAKAISLSHNQLYFYEQAKALLRFVQEASTTFKHA